MTTVQETNPRRLSWMRIRSIARRHYYVMLRSPHRLFDVTIWPLVDVVLFGSIGAFVAGSDNAGAAAFGYLLGGIVLWHIIYQSQIAVSTGFLEETWTRNLLNIMVTPVKEWEYVAGVALFGLVKLVAGTGLVAITALLLFSFDITELGLGLIPIGAILLTVGWLIALFVIGFVLRYGSGAEALAWGILFVVMPLSGVFYPVDSLPVIVRPLALVLPTTYAFEAMRNLLDGDGIDWATIGIATVSTLVLTVLALAFLMRMLRLFRARGYISRYS
ncbi:MAG: ABC transporter permease [Actinomycetota bacterium]